MIRGFTAAALAGFCIAGNAACDTGLAERMHAKLHPERRLDHERAACEPWRGVAGRFIVLLPLPRQARETLQPDIAEFDLDVLVVQQADNGNTERARIVSRLFESRALIEDDQSIAALKVDTARYALAPDARAFGVRVVYRGATRANPYESERLSLYVPQGSQLEKVLDGLETTLERGEWDTNCTGNFETMRSNVSVVRSAGNGYGDLLLHRTRSRSRSSLQGDECVTREQPATFLSSTLRFDGKRYRLPKS